MTDAPTAPAGVDAPWELFYWARLEADGKNHMIGRGEFVRLMFEVAGVPYIDHGVVSARERLLRTNASKVVATSEERNVVANFCWGEGNGAGFPVFAPPAIRKGSFVLSQTPSIMKYLGKEFGLYPTTREDEAHADSLLNTLTDCICEGRLVFHSKAFCQSYYDQVEEVKPTVAWFEAERLGDFMWYFDQTLRYNAENAKHTDGFFIGNTLTYVDIAAFHVIEASASQFPVGYSKLETLYPALAAFRTRIASLPNLAAYLASDRRGLFEGNSMM